MNEKVTPLFNNVDEKEKKDAFDWYDIAEEVKRDFEEKEEKAKMLAIPKIASMAIEMYITNPEVFIPEFNKLISHIKLNSKLKEKCKTKEERKAVYDAIRSFDFHSKVKSFNISYKMASEEHGVPEKYLRSIIGTRNNLKRNSIKIK